MSTKKLSRTVIEGGRVGHNKWERRHSHTEVRAEERDYLKQVMIDPDLADELEVGEKRPIMKEFTDKLNPMYRWLDAQVGRPWSEVRSEVFQKFDTRTTAGRHITFDHLLREVVDTESGFDKHGCIADPTISKMEVNGKRRRYWSVADYYVDREGIMRKRETSRYSRSRGESIKEEDLRQAEAWLGGRMVMEQGGVLYWITPNEGVWMASWFDPNTKGLNYATYYSSKLVYYVRRNGEYKTRAAYYLEHNRYAPYFTIVNTSGDHWEAVENPYSFRQRGELTAEEVKTFRSFKNQIQQDILAYGKGRL